MRKLTYQLVKEDYKSWIHWNVVRHESPKTKMISIAVYVAFVALFLGRNIVTGRGNLLVMLNSVFFALLVGGMMFYMTSTHNQERIVWKKSGLGRLEKENRFPVVELTILDKGIVMEVAAEGVKNEYSFKDILGILEIERLFLLEASNKTWQFVAKTAFESREEMEEFRSLMEEKIEDAKEHPENYVSGKAEDTASETVPDAGTEDVPGENGRPAEGPASEIGETDVSRTEETQEPEVAIEPVDTSRMGKIGKMAHIMAAENNEKTETEAEGDAAQAAGAAVKTAGNAETADAKEQE